MTDYLFDTLVILEIAQGRPELQQRVQRLFGHADTGAFSTVSEAELLGLALPDDQRKALENLLGLMKPVSVTKRVAREASRLHRQKGFPIPDALIAASAIISGRKLVTRDSAFARLDPSLVEIIPP